MARQATRSAATSFSTAKVNAMVTSLLSDGRANARRRWLKLVAARVTEHRPDLADVLVEVLGELPTDEDSLLTAMSIGEIGVCYEAFTAESDRTSRKASGQFFTPDDAAEFMAKQADSFPAGIWLDPCCGVGNLAWHLAHRSRSRASFVRDRLVLVDKDGTALRTAVAVLAAEFLDVDDVDGVRKLWSRATSVDYLRSRRIPEHDFVIVNPPYARTEIRPGFRTAATRDLFSYFMEKVATTSRGFISVTPASYLSAPKYQVLRDLINETMTAGDIYVFDNVPDTLFRGYKYGSNNTSKTNFVRAAITVCSPSQSDWRETPILRWKSVSRARMLRDAHHFLSPRQFGPAGEWAKVPADLQGEWTMMNLAEDTLSDLTVAGPTDYSLTVALTPRYYISAAYRNLSRSSKVVLYFVDEVDRDRAAVVINSSAAYLWWRALDGGVTLPRRVLNSLPVPDITVPSAVVSLLRSTEESSLVTKLNAGVINENVKRPREVVDAANRVVFGNSVDSEALYSEDMFTG